MLLLILIIGFVDKFINVKGLINFIDEGSLILSRLLKLLKELGFNWLELVMFKF